MVPNRRKIEEENILLSYSKIDSSASIIGSRLYGNVCIGKDCKVINSIMSGNITLHDNASVRKNVHISSDSSVTIGRFTTINGPNTDITCAINKVEIGAFCSIARNVVIQEFNHDFGRFTSYFIEQNMMGKTDFSEPVSNGNILVGNDVWIGTHCVVLGGSTIGDGAVANSVVVGDIPPYAIAGGSPARVLRYRFDKTRIKEIQESEWWLNINESNYESYKTRFDS
jgi:virginiamycin A acetyltransferase